MTVDVLILVFLQVCEAKMGWNPPPELPLKNAYVPDRFANTNLNNVYGG